MTKRLARMVAKHRFGESPDSRHDQPAYPQHRGATHPVQERTTTMFINRTISRACRPGPRPRMVARRAGV